MTITKRRAGLSAIAGAGIIVLLAGCGQAPEESGGDDGGDAASDFLPCMVSDAGGFDDKSFNQLGFEGLTKAADELEVEPKTVESATETDYEPNLESLIDQGCDLIVTVGFLLAPATAKAAENNPDVEFVSIDDTVDIDQDGETDSPNIKPIIFDTAQAAYLGGYLAAGVSETGVIGTFGGVNIPTVTIFMEGFKQGADHYNEVKGKDVQTLGLDTFTGGFEAGIEAQTAAQGLIDQNVDVLLPVGGPIYQSAASAIRDADREIALVGVDADVYESDSTVADLLLTSIRKGIDVGVYDAVLAAGQDEFDSTPFVGTLENGGVSLADFHDWADRVPAELADEVSALQEQIISGEVTVESYLAQ
ncbi:BMP family ABC transporter substrate-binding protein [Okibacterium endophyticum]